MDKGAKGLRLCLKLNAFVVGGCLTRERIQALTKNINARNAVIT